MNNTTENFAKNNTARFKIIPSILSDEEKNYQYFVPFKVLITSQYNYELISGSIEFNISLHARINSEINDIYNKKVCCISDTKSKKCLNIDFEIVNKEYIELVIRYNKGNNTFDIKVLSEKPIIEDPILSFEDISSIVDWY